MTAENQKIVLGTRGSELARAQARLVEKAIQTMRTEAKIETKIIATKGDKVRVLDLRAGRKGLFTAEIERALVAGDIDVAVHSAKDLPSETSPDAEIAAVLPRAAVDDILVSQHPGGLASLPHGATVATGSVQFWYYVSDITKFSASNQIELGSGGGPDIKEYNWPVGTLVNGWNLITKTFSSAGTTGGTPDLNAINWFRIYHAKTGSITTKVDAIQILH